MKKLFSLPETNGKNIVLCLTAGIEWIYIDKTSIKAFLSEKQKGKGILMTQKKILEERVRIN